MADDDATTRLLIRAALEQDGWTVEEAEDGAQAYEAVERIQPNILLLDVGMPELDGFDVCARLRALSSARHIPIMMMTGMDDQESINRAYEVGATDFLSKPFNYMVLKERLRYMYRAEQDSRELRNERDFVSAVVNNSAALVMILNSAGRVIRFNESCQRASGLSLSDVTGQYVWDVLSSPEGRGRDRDTFEQLVFARGTNHYEGSWRTKDGSEREIAWSNSVLLNRDGGVEHVVCTGLDITERNEAEEKVRFLASYDPLTGLPNRRLVTERLDQAVVDGQSAILILNLDRFKNVNATWGRSRLSTVLARQNPGLRAELGRLGGDEFTVLVTGIEEASEVAAIAERLQHALERPFKIEDQELATTASIGVALYPTDGLNGEMLLRNAESAVHSARETMSGSYHFYSVTMRSSVSDRMSLETDLRQAITRGELVLHYQPKTFTRSGHIAGAEALVRWQHPSRGLVSPASFISVAEETGLIVPIGEWVLRQACGQVMSWMESGLHVVPVAVNLSSAQFHVADLLGHIASILNETALDPSYLAIEITESMIMRDAREAHETLCRLKELGVQVAIDDFGTGYSTLSSLKDLPINQLKIDQAFVRDLAENPKDVAITRAIIAMAHGLGLTVIAEGVESEDQLAVLREEGCDEVQGFLIGQPRPSDEFTEFLEQTNRETVGVHASSGGS